MVEPYSYDHIMELGSLSLENVGARIDRFIAQIPPYPEDYAGRGIVICGGGLKYFPGAWVCIRMLRQLGCTLPVEVWHLGAKEMNDDLRGLLASYNARCIDAFEVQKAKPCRILRGWELKVYSVLHSSFREVLLLDADNVPVIDPTYLFETYPYDELGAVFWPDTTRDAHVSSYNPNVWKACGMEAPLGQPEFETGQLLVDKQRVWRPLCLTMWMNEYSDFFYRYVYGDKETFNLAWRKLGVSFAMPARSIHHAPYTMCQHDFQGRRLFQHRNEAKWNLEDNRTLPDFLFEEDCLAYVWELAARWDGRTDGVPRFVDDDSQPPEVRLAVHHLVAHTHLYKVFGREERLISFCLDGTISLGRKNSEIFWDLRQEDELCLYLSSASEVTCRLRLDDRCIWAGNWQLHECFAVQIRVLPRSSDCAAQPRSAGA